MDGSFASSRSVIWWLVGSTVCSQSRKGCWGVITIADRFSIFMNCAVSSSLPFIPVVQVDHLANRDDFPLRLDCSWLRRVLLQGQMRWRLIIVRKIVLQYPSKVPWSKNCKVVQALASNRADKSLSEPVLPRALWCGDDLLYPQRLHTTPEFDAKDSVPITNQVSLKHFRSVSVGKCFNDPLPSPGGGGVIRHSKLQHLAPFVLKDEKHLEQPQADRGHREEVGRDEFAGMISQESFPSLRGRSFDAAQDS